MHKTKEGIMEDVEKLVKTSLGEIERILNTKTVIGEPMSIEGNTIIPLISIGFGFGAGGGAGKGETAVKGEGTGGGTGGGGGIRPVAIIVVNKDGVKVEPIKEGKPSIVEKVSEVVGKAMEKHGEKKKEE